MLKIDFLNADYLCYGCISMTNDKVEDEHYRQMMTTSKMTNSSRTKRTAAPMTAMMKAGKALADSAANITQTKHTSNCT